MDKLACMKAFVAVADAEGFSNAARQTRQTKALLSKYVAQLENSLNMRLFHRTTRQISLTEVGRAYYERCLPLLDELDEIEAAVRDIHTMPSGELNICAPTSFSELHLMPVISSFSMQYPDIRINIGLSDRIVNIVEEGFDMALRIGTLTDSSLIAQRICPIHMMVCASGEYLRRNGEPQQPKDLLQHECIIDTNYREEAVWYFEHEGNKERVPVKGRYHINSAVAVKELALAHNGIARCPTFVTGDEIKANRLVVVLPEYKIEEFGLYALYSHRRHLSTKVRLFMIELRNYFSKRLVWG